jgi:transketolase
VDTTLLPANRPFHPARLRQTVLKMAHAGATVHIACAFSIIELVAVLHRHHLRYPGNAARAEGRDYFVLSKGHGVMAQYACMHERGWLSDADLETYFADGTALKGLSDSRIPGLEVTSGSLGHGFSVGVGLAMGLQRLRSDQKVYTLVGDGEINEGPVWEGALVAAHHRLDNLMMIVDCNGFQAMGRTEEVLSLGDLPAKLASFGFAVQVVDGHDEQAIDTAVRSLWQQHPGQPKALVANTVKGKGVPFMEHQNQWHYTRLNEQTFAEAMATVAAGLEAA